MTLHQTGFGRERGGGGSLRTYATKYFPFETFSILCMQFVLCMGYPFMK